MTPTQTVQLVALVASVCPSMRMEETTADAWHALLADLDHDDARAAVLRLGRRQRYIAACDIRDEVRVIRHDRLARTPVPAPPADLEPVAHRDELRHTVAAIAAGRSLDRALTTGRPEPTPPTQARTQAHGTARDPRRLAAIAVGCPWCHEPAGRPCVNAIGRPLATQPAHQARLDAATKREVGSC